MSAYEEFEKIIFGFTMEASELGGQTAFDQVEYGHIFHFEDKDAIKFLEKNAAELSESSLARLKGNLDDTIIAGVRDGKAIKEITKDVAGIFDDFRGYEAERIARTEVSRGVNNGALVGFAEMGVKIVEYYANAGACPLCSAHHGDLMTIDQAMNFIPLHPNCYCFWVSRSDITNENVEGWKGLGEISNEVVEGLKLDLPFTRVSMAPGVINKVYKKGSFHPNTPERVRLVVENAQYGFIDEDKIVHLLTVDVEGGWNMVPVKQTEDMGLVARTSFRFKDDNYLTNKLNQAEKIYGF